MILTEFMNMIIYLQPAHQKTAEGLFDFVEKYSLQYEQRMNYENHLSNIGSESV